MTMTASEITEACMEWLDKKGAKDFPSDKVRFVVHVQNSRGFPEDYDSATCKSLKVELVAETDTCFVQGPYR